MIGMLSNEGQWYTRPKPAKVKFNRKKFKRDFKGRKHKPKKANCNMFTLDENGITITVKTMQ